MDGPNFTNEEFVKHLKEEDALEKARRKAVVPSAAETPERKAQYCVKVLFKPFYLKRFDEKSFQRSLEFMLTKIFITQQKLRDTLIFMVDMTDKDGKIPIEALKKAQELIEKGVPEKTSVREKQTPESCSHKHWTMGSGYMGRGQRNYFKCEDCQSYLRPEWIRVDAFGKDIES